MTEDVMDNQEQIRKHLDQARCEAQWPSVAIKELASAIELLLDNMLARTEGLVNVADAQKDDLKATIGVIGLLAEHTGFKKKNQLDRAKRATARVKRRGGHRKT